MRLHNLPPESPIDWVMAMLTKRGGHHDRKKRTIFSTWVSWSISKGFLANCGQEEGPYLSWKPFTVREIKMFMGLLILNGISISRRLE